jgi:DNA-directed RNA polymerase specialized sigma24 family protein
MSQGDSGDAYETEIEIDGDLAHFACIFGASSGLAAVDTAIDLRAALADEPEDNKSIIELICQGFNKAEISKKTGISAQKITKILERIGCKIKSLETESTVEEAYK